MAKKKPARKTGAAAIETIEDKPEAQPEPEKQNSQTSFNYGANAEMATTKKKAAPKKGTKKRRGPQGESIAAQARAYAAEHPKATTQEIADALKTKYVNVFQALKKKGDKPAVKKYGKRTKPAASGTEVGNGHTAGEFVKTALGMGLDRAISTLEKVRSALGE